MADKKISELTNITGANLQDTDEFVVVDTSANETKAITYAELKKFNAGTDDGIFVEDNNTSNTSPFVKVRGKRGDANVSQTFAGKLLLDGNRTDAAVNSGKKIGTVAFGGNHTDGSDANILYPASISGVAEGTFSNSTTMPTGLAFHTGSTGRSESTANVTFGDEAMRLTSLGRVGIGTTAPVTTLDVAGNARISNIIFTDGEDLTISADNNNSAAASTVNILVDGTEVADFTHGGTLRFNRAGYASGGICVQVNDNVLGLAGGTNAINSGLNIALSGPDHTAGNRGLLMRDGTTVVYNYQRALDAHLWYTGVSERMRITSGGNVGIGTSNPRSGLHVYGAGQQTANITDAGNQAAFLRVSESTSLAGGGGGIIFATLQSDDTGAVGMAAIKGLAVNGTDNTIGDLAFSTRNVVTDTALTERMRIKSNGNVGIGTSTPGSKLSIVGLPTSSAGLSAGDVWNDSGTLKIVT